MGRWGDAVLGRRILHVRIAELKAINSSGHVQTQTDTGTADVVEN